MARTLLIVDDIKSNREILKNILGEDYAILEAAHGREALALMNLEFDKLSAVLLDLRMPVMDGFEVLECMRSDTTLSQLPVIVMTGQTDSDTEERALKLGAKDYISKPYQSAIIKQRIWNTINLRETAAMVNTLQRDKLTGVWNREAFFQRAAMEIRREPAGYFILACVDIDNFKVVNDQYGSDMGDRVLKSLADSLRQSCERNGGICGRIFADRFVSLYPCSLVATASIGPARLENHIRADVGLSLQLSVGRYVVEDRGLSVSAMYDRATLAQNVVKGRYDEQVGVYDESMRDHLVDEQAIVNDMNAALAERQFEPWFQPQYNHSTGALIGAEALARWRHPQRGLIPPGVFIPVFERNGFVYELDKCIWEQVCQSLRQWMDEGRSPLPVSVNISRYDVFRDDLVEVIAGLIAKYRVPVELLRLEITESAFANSTEQIVRVVKALIARGFTVEIDDFGSGYSSLNTLKDVPAQVLKLDMRFLKASERWIDDDCEDVSSRGGNILESIVRMAKWLGMSVIAEGVERKAQADYLNSIGCPYIQGYLYAKPMPKADYEALCKDAGKEEKLLAMDTVENLDNNAFWNPESMDTLIFNSYVGAACIFEFYQGKIEMLRVSEKFARMIAGAGMSIEDALKLDWISCLDADSRERIVADLDRSAETKRDVSGEYTFLGLSSGEAHLRSSLRVIASAGGRRLVYCTAENITAQREAERREHELTEQLQTVMDDVPGGFARIRVLPDGLTRPVFVNGGLCELLRRGREETLALYDGDPYRSVHPEDAPRVRATVERMCREGTVGGVRYRLLCSGEYLWVSIFGRATKDAGGDVYLNLYYADATEQARAEEQRREILDNLPYGVALYEYDGERLSAEHINKRYWELVNRTEVAYADSSFMDALYPDDREQIDRELRAALRENRDIACDVRLRYGADGYRPFHIAGHVLRAHDGRYSIYAAYTPISDAAMSLQDMLPIALSAMMDYQTGYSFVKDRSLRYVCASRELATLSGCASPAEMLGKTDGDLMEKSLAELFAADDRRVLESGESLTDVINRLPSPDGATRYASTSKFPLRDAQGNIVGVFGVGRDVTESRAMQSQFELLTNSIPGGIATYEYANGAFRLTYFSDGFCSLFNLTRAEYASFGAGDAFYGVFADDLPALRKQLDAYVNGGVQLDCVYRVRLRDGGYKWINLKAGTPEREGDRLVFNAVLFDVTQRQDAMERMRISEEENRLAMLQTRNSVCRFNAVSRTLRVPEGAQKEYYMAAEVTDIPEGPIARGEVSPETADAYRAFYEGAMHGPETGSATFQRRAEHGWRWLEAHYSAIRSDEGKPVSAVVSFTDVTEQREKDAAYKKWQQSFLGRPRDSYSLFRCSLKDHPSSDSREGLLLDVPFDVGPFGFDERTARYAAEYVWEDDRERFLAFLSVDALLSGYYQGQRVSTLEYRERRTDGRFRWLRLTVDLVEHAHADDIEAYLLFENIDRAKRLELATIEQAETDPLTGVLNRTTFAAKVDNLLQTALPNAQHALMMLDMDNFKQINDAFGHGAGDQLLIDVAGSLRTALRHDDLVCRLGGDEFLVFLPDIPGDVIAATKAKQFCALTRKAFSAEVEISGSIGMTIAPRDGTDFETLYRKADVALYHVKGAGKDNYAFYHDGMSGERLVSEVGPAPLAESPKPEKKRRMLIVDDSRIDHAMLSNIFADQFIVEKARDGDTALIRLRHYGSAISVVLLDLMMPGMDGFSVLRKMQESMELRGIPVIVVSGDENRETNLRAISEGAVDFVGKPVDPDILRIRVASAISKAENERLRAKNSFLEYQNSEVTRYKIALERSGIIVVENDWVAGTFSYDPSISRYIAGVYDERSLWHIFLSDLVAETATVQKMQETVQKVAADRKRSSERLLVRLKTPNKARHWFRMNAYKVINEFGLAGKIYLTFVDAGPDKPAEP